MILVFMDDDDDDVDSNGGATTITLKHARVKHLVYSVMSWKVCVALSWLDCW